MRESAANCDLLRPPSDSLGDSSRWIAIVARPCPRLMPCSTCEYLAAGRTGAEILRDFPDLAAEDIRACLAFAADRERKLASAPPA